MRQILREKGQDAASSKGMLPLTTLPLMAVSRIQQRQGGVPLSFSREASSANTLNLNV